MTTPRHPDAAAFEEFGNARPGRHFDRVVCCSGHMIDRDDRHTPRFPQSRERTVRASMDAILGRWNIGPGALAVSGGARGADILFAELCLARGAWVRLLIALPDEPFIERSVSLPGTDWEQRYRRLRHQCETWHWSDRANARLEPREAMDRTNHWILDTCQAEAAPDRFLTLLVWDERASGDGRGGTADFAAAARRLGGEVAVVNPTLVSKDAR